MEKLVVRSVVISLWSAGSCGRKQLAGILRYVNAGHPWRVRIIMDPKEFTAEAVVRAREQGVDGFIAFAEEEASKALAATTIPTVLLSGATPELAKRKRNLVVFVNDNEAIGRKGAEHFIPLGTFATYAYVPDPCGRDWSSPREDGFCRRLKEVGRDCIVYRRENGEMADWLAGLPRPIAVMTPYDFLARDVVEACRNAGLSVPTQVAVLGVDNDDLVCEATRPTISSIAIDQERIGYLAASTLDRLMSSRKPCPTETVCVTSGNVVERESTRHISPGVNLVRRIGQYIEDHYRESIGPDDVARNLGVSRRLVELRFSESTGTTVRGAIEERRLEEIKRQLVGTTLPIGKITALCGFQNGLWVKYVFKKRFGMTMSEWRKRGR